MLYPHEFTEPLRQPREGADTVINPVFWMEKLRLRYAKGTDMKGSGILKVSASTELEEWSWNWNGANPGFQNLAESQNSA